MADLETCSDRNSTSYYSVLGICKQATPHEIRGAYRKLALKWHPDRWMQDPKVVGEAKRRFQQIQEAYSVLSDKGKRSVYDAGLFHLCSDDVYDDEGLSEFMQEMAHIMKSTRHQKGHSLEELQDMLIDMISDVFDDSMPHFSRKRTRTA